MEVESSNKWIASTVNFVLEDNIYLRLTSEDAGLSLMLPVIWYKAVAGDKFQHVLDDHKLNAAWEAHEIQ